MASGEPPPQENWPLAADVLAWSRHDMELARVTVLGGALSSRFVLPVGQQAALAALASVASVASMAAPTAPNWGRCARTNIRQICHGQIFQFSVSLCRHFMRALGAGKICFIILQQLQLAPTATIITATTTRTLTTIPNDCNMQIINFSTPQPPETIHISFCSKLVTPNGRH